MGYRGNFSNFLNDPPENGWQDACRKRISDTCDNRRRSVTRIGHGHEHGTYSLGVPEAVADRAKL